MRKQQILILGVSVFLLLVGGCDSFRSIFRSKKANVTEEIEVTQAEKDRTALLKKVDSNFNNPKVHYELGKSYQLDGLWIQAEQEYMTALNFDPSHRMAQAARVNVLLNIGDNAKAQLLADEYIERVSVSAKGSLELGLGFQSQGLDDYALRCYNQALRLQPNSAKINRQVGYYYLSKGQTVQAQDYLTRSFQLNPNQPTVARQLGKLGVIVKVPTKKGKSPESLDKMVDKYDKEAGR